MQEVEIRRIEVPGQTRQNSWQDPISTAGSLKQED
jgi:hypothetical protein